MKILAIKAIEFYQKYVSPRKGFCCAHRVVHHGYFCSEYAKQAIIEYGLWPSLAVIKRRFAECKLAAIQYQASQTEKDEVRGGRDAPRKGKMEKTCDSIGCLDCDVFDCSLF